MNADSIVTFGLAGLPVAASPFLILAWKRGAPPVRSLPSPLRAGKLIPSMLILSVAAFRLGGLDLWLWLLLYALVFVAVDALSVVPHELAHWAVGRQLGFLVPDVTFGRSATVLSGRIAETRFALGALPSGGATWLTTSEPAGHRWRMVAVLAAGPATNLLLLAIVWPFHGQAAAVTAVVQIVILIGSLFFARGDLRKLLVLSVARTAAVNEGFVAQAPAAVVAHLTAGRAAEAEAGCRAMLRICPSDAPARAQLGLCAGAGKRHAEALSWLRPVHEEAHGPPLRALVANGLAWSAMMEGHLDEADSASEQAFEAAPAMPAIRDTRGAVLVRIGRVPEGLALLRPLLDEPMPASSRAHALCSIAIGELALGEIDAARANLARARDEDPCCEALVHVEARLSPTSTGQT